MSGGAGSHLTGDPRAERPLGALLIVVGLEIDPEVGARAEIAGDPNCNAHTSTGRLPTMIARTR